MKTIHFKNSKNWAYVFAVVYNRDESICERIKLTEQDSDGDYTLKFDNDKYDHMEFLDSKGVMTSKVYPGALSMGVEYKKNEEMQRDLTYLFSKNCDSTGRVDNFVLEDAKNLTHRDDRSKKISVFIPATYDGKTPHDILYFFDAQNLFCDAGEYTKNGDPYGGWQLDVVLSEIHRQHGKNIIVVGIDNADQYRSQELFMDSASFGALSIMGKSTPGENFSRGFLDGLSEFMVKTLHPFIKDRYVVREDNIGIGGSSMGGIAAFYCGMRELGFYKYVLSYSPAFGLYKMNAFKKYFSTLNFNGNIAVLPKIHIYCGRGDSLEKMLLPSAKKMKKILVNYGYPEDNIFETFDTEKPHNEESWRLILPQSFTYLL